MREREEAQHPLGFIISGPGDLGLRDHFACVTGDDQQERRVSQIAVVDDRFPPRGAAPSGDSSAKIDQAASSFLLFRSTFIAIWCVAPLTAVARAIGPACAGLPVVRRCAR